MSKMKLAGASSIVMVGLVGCQGSDSGNLRALTLGDVTHPAERGSPIEAIRAACGTGGPTGGTQMTREPYLQMVTPTEAMVGWASTSAVGRVPITTAARVDVTTANAEVDQTVDRSRANDEQQLWARATNLVPDSIHCYTVMDGDTPLTVPTGFRTAPAADDPDPVRFLAFGDSGGGGEDQHALLEHMYEFPYDLMIHTGDIAYTDGSHTEFQDNVFNVYGDLFRNIPFFPAAGNHEYRTLQGAPFRDVFALPGDSGEKWYSYDWGRVHFAAIDTEADYETQAAWLDYDLGETDRPWKIVYLHRPPYSSGEHGSDMALRAALAPVLERHQVQLVLAGHDHDYERMEPQNGVNYVVTGGGGVGTRAVGSSDFTAYSAAVIHFVYVEVGIDELVLHAVDGTGIEFDSLVVPRQLTAP